jgi:hypothetical protein
MSITIVYSGNTPEHVKQMFEKLVEKYMADIEKDVLAAKGGIEVRYIDDKNAGVRAVCSNTELRDRMTNKLNAILAQLWDN